jgi:protein-L-isoaspartate(D-aspartate) O-methyltransferase
MNDEEPYASERQRMVSTQIARRGIRDKRVLEAMRTVPRHLFVGQEYRHLAYTDGPLPIGSGQTISQPYIVALMTQLLTLSGEECVLEIGTGSGYQAAVLAHIARQVHTIERHAVLVERAMAVLSELGLENVYVHLGDGTLGLREHAPYDAIIVTAAAPRAPQALLDQLKQGGRLVIPVGSLGAQFLERWTCQENDYQCEEIIPVAFVPLIGEQGWNE